MKMKGGQERERKYKSGKEARKEGKRTKRKGRK